MSTFGKPRLGSDGAFVKRKSCPTGNGCQFFLHVSIASSAAPGEVSVAYLPGAGHPLDQRPLYRSVRLTCPFCSLTACVRPCCQPPLQKLLVMKPILTMFVFLVFWDPALTGKMGIFLVGESGGPWSKRKILSKSMNVLPPWTLQLSKWKKQQSALISARSELEPWLSNLLTVQL